LALRHLGRTLRLQCWKRFISPPLTFSLTV
jgi:hypothetical protein